MFVCNETVRINFKGWMQKITYDDVICKERLYALGYAAPQRTNN
jgi:hypothetical protein